MDHTHTEPSPSDAFSGAMLAVINALKLVKDDPQIRDAVQVLARNPQVQKAARELANIFAPTDSIQNEEIYAAVDNSPLGSIESEPIVFHDVLDPKVDNSGCSVDAVVDVPVEALPRRPILSLLVPPTPMNGRNKCALVIEHDQSLSRMFKKLLECENYVVRTARDGEDAVHLYRDCAPFEVVLVQYGMPRKHGINVALEILEQDPTQPMIIIASDYRSEADVLRPKELMHVPLLIDMSNSRLRKLLESIQPWATRQEVDKAVETLTTGELLRLKQFGEARVSFSHGADYRTGEDLLQEALRLTFEGNRRWNKRVSFETCLTGVIKSISRRRKGDRITDGEDFCVLDTFAGNNVAADENLIAKEQVAEVFAVFEDDMEATQVIQGWFDGLKKNGIMQKHGFSENRYRAAVKRIRIKLLSPNNGGGGGEKHDGQD
jgi:CheY-like chemotaxis protein